MKAVVVFVEQDQGTVRRTGLEMCSKAAQLARQLGSVSIGVVLGPDSQKAAEKLKAVPLDQIRTGEDVPVDKYLLDPALDAMEALLKQTGPALVLLPSTNTGKDLAARMAVRLDAGIITEANEISVENGAVKAQSPKFGGSMLSKIGFRSKDYQIVVCRANSFPASNEAGKGEISKLAGVPQKQYATVIHERVAQEAGKLSVDEATIVVSGGRGLGAAERFDIVQALAEALGAAVGASRAAVDAGWIAHAHQVGQTGKSISPQLYIACGISGAIQHKVGMRSATTIVAINKDANAPIFEFCDLGVVGDLFTIVPALTKLVEQRKGAA